MAKTFAKAANAFNFVWDQGDAQATAEIEILMQSILEEKQCPDGNTK